jgi:hypothetical protein
MVTGSAALVYYWFQNRFAVTPEPALIKATLINFAYDLYLAKHPNPPITGYVPEAHQGWGKVDLARAFKTDGRYAWANQQYVLTPGSPTFTSLVLAVKDSNKPVRVTLVWTDPPGGVTTKQLRNDLDLQVVNATNISWYCAGNNFNPANGRSKVFNVLGPPYPTWDRTNNVEQITFLTSELQGTTFQIYVTGSSIPADALNVWNPTSTLQQDFALFVENIIGH